MTTEIHVWTCNSFAVYYPVGTAAVVAASTAKLAAKALNDALVAHGLVGKVKAADMKKFRVAQGNVNILCDGNY